MKLGVLVLAMCVGAFAFGDPGSQPRFRIDVTKQGFEPAEITVPAKKLVTLVFTRKTESTCTKSVVLKLDDGKTLERKLPLDKPVEIAVTFPKAGRLTYACSMDMNKGVVVVQ